MNKPDYQGSGIVNLMSSIIQARGGRSDNPALDLLPVEDLARATNLILLVIDGLGTDWLVRHSPNGILNSARRGTITSVFPPTTAAAITTYLTGDAPLQHGLTGWYTYLRELGCVMTVLPGKPRYGGVSYRRAGIDPGKLFGHTSVFDRIKTRGIIVSPHFIARSDFNLAHAGRAEILAFDGLRDLFRQTLRALRPSIAGAGRTSRTRNISISTGRHWTPSVTSRAWKARRRWPIWPRSSRRSRTSRPPPPAPTPCC